jgi:hypothetical protein
MTSCALPGCNRTAKKRYCSPEHANKHRQKRYRARSYCKECGFVDCPHTPKSQVCLKVRTKINRNANRNKRYVTEGEATVPEKEGVYKEPGDSPNNVEILGHNYRYRFPIPENLKDKVLDLLKHDQTRKRPNWKPVFYGKKRTPSKFTHSGIADHLRNLDMIPRERTEKPPVTVQIGAVNAPSVEVHINDSAKVSPDRLDEVLEAIREQIMDDLGDIQLGEAEPYKRRGDKGEDLPAHYTIEHESAKQIGEKHGVPFGGDQRPQDSEQNLKIDGTHPESFETESLRLAQIMQHLLKIYPSLNFQGLEDPEKALAITQAPQDIRNIGRGVEFLEGAMEEHRAAINTLQGDMGPVVLQLDAIRQTVKRSPTSGDIAALGEAMRDTLYDTNSNLANLVDELRRGRESKGGFWGPLTKILKRWKW